MYEYEVVVLCVVVVPDEHLCSTLPTCPRSPVSRFPTGDGDDGEMDGWMDGR